MIFHFCVCNIIHYYLLCVTIGPIDYFIHTAVSVDTELRRLSRSYSVPICKLSGNARETYAEHKNTERKLFKHVVVTIVNKCQVLLPPDVRHKFCINFVNKGRLHSLAIPINHKKLLLC